MLLSRCDFLLLPLSLAAFTRSVCLFVRCQIDNFSDGGEEIAARSVYIRTYKGENRGDNDDGNGDGDGDDGVAYASVGRRDIVAHVILVSDDDDDDDGDVVRSPLLRAVSIVAVLYLRWYTLRSLQRGHTITCFIHKTCK